MTDSKRFADKIKKNYSDPEDTKLDVILYQDIYPIRFQSVVPITQLSVAIVSQAVLIRGVKVYLKVRVEPFWSYSIGLRKGSIVG